MTPTLRMDHILHNRPTVNMKAIQCSTTQYSVQLLYILFCLAALQKRKLSEKSGPWDYRNRSIWEKYFARGQMPSARQKRHQTVSIKLADCQDSCRVFVLTSRSDHVIVYATAKLIMDGGLPNYRPTRLNDSGNFFRPLTNK